MNSIQPTPVRETDPARRLAEHGIENPRPPTTCAELPPLLERIEQGGTADDATLATAREHVSACPVCAARHARRLVACEGLLALRVREVPCGLLDGLLAAVEASAPFAPLGGGMSQAFLDGPRALRAWRSAAVAAGLLLAVGAGLVASGWLTPRRDGPRAIPILDARGALLEDVELPGPTANGSSDSRFTTVSWPQHRSGQRFFWFSPAAVRGGAPASDLPARWD